jgi:acyl carrier protein
MRPFTLGDTIMTTDANQTAVFEEVQSVVAEVLNVPEARVTANADFKTDLEAESLDLVSIIAELEDRFDQDITDDDAMALRTVGDAVRYIETVLHKEA